MHNYCSNECIQKVIIVMNLLIAVVAIVMHHIISHHWLVHGVASSSSRKCELTNRYTPSRTSGCLRFPLIYLVDADTIGLLFLISCGGV